MTHNRGDRFARLPSNRASRTVAGRATREAVVAWWHTRFGIPPDTFNGYTFYEKGAGKIWICNGTVQTPLAIEALGMRVLHTRQEYWKPTTNAVQRFGTDATRNIISLDATAAARFVAGETQAIPWDGDWGYLIVTRQLAGHRAPIGVGLYTHGELSSQIAKGRQRTLPPL